MHDADKILAAYRAGHFWNKSKPDVLNVDESSAQKLTIDHPIARQAIQSWQEADANFDLLGWACHHRKPECDGECGPATAMLMELPRCAMPDHAPPENAAFEYGDREINEAVRSYQRWASLKAGGSGSWPIPGCDPNRRDVHSTLVSITTSGFSQHQKDTFKEAHALVEKCEAEFGQSVRHVLDGSPSNCQHDVRGQNIPGGVIGFAYFPDPGTCNQTVTCRIDNSFNPKASTLAELYVHEYKGHSDGLEHTRGGIMNPSIIGLTSLSWKGDPSEAVKRRYFGGVPINPPTPPSPPVGPALNGALFAEPVGNIIAIRGELVLNQSGTAFKYIAVPDGSGKFVLVQKPSL